MTVANEDRTAEQFKFYASQYARFTSDVAAAVRREVYGEDLGQQGWRTLDEQAAIVEMIDELSPCHVLDIACGSGGPSLALVERTGCRLTGVDVEAEGIGQAERQALARGFADRARFATLDCSRRLPFEDRTFDLVVCIDAALHLGDRFVALADWSRLLRSGGRLIYTDAAVLTGPLSREEINIRASQGPFLLTPPGLNERAVDAAGLVLRRRQDRTRAIAEIASRWHAARERHAADLQREEGADWFARRQRFLATTADLAASGRLSRFLYVAERPAASLSPPRAHQPSRSL